MKKALFELDRKQVGTWRSRWQASFDALVAVECRESEAALRRVIENVLSDAPRAGSPGTFTAEQVTEVLAVACEEPSQSELPIDDWTARELAAEVVRREIVESISPSTVQRYLLTRNFDPARNAGVHAAGECDVDFTTDATARSRATLGSSGFGIGLVLVLSITYSYSIRAADTVSVRWIRRVNRDTIRFKSDFPRGSDSSSIASQTRSTS